MSRNSRAASIAAVILLAYLVLFWRLGSATFWDPDEAHYAETTRELIVGGDWLAPMFEGQPFFDKPIFFHWLQGTAMKVMGPTEAAARTAPALAALALVGITWWFGAQLVGLEVGALGALILLCNPGVFGLTRYAILDTSMTAFLFGGAALVSVAAIKGPSRLQYAGYAAVGLAAFVKGPVALILCGVAFACAMVLSADTRRRLLSLHYMRGVAIAVIIAAPWFVYMYLRFGGAFVDGYILKENVQLFAKPLYGNQPGWWFYVAILIPGFMPWTWLALGRAYDVLRGVATRRRSPDVVEVLLWSWVIGIVTFFSLSQFKLDHYVFPVAPALSLIAARAWQDARRPPDGTNRGARVGAAMMGPTLVVVGMVVAVLVTRLLATPRSFLVVPAGLVILGVVATWRYTLRLANLPRQPLLVVASLALVYVGALGWIIPDLERLKVVPDVARWVASHAEPQDRVATFRLNRWNPAYRFYVDRQIVRLESDDEARQFFSDRSPFYCVMTSDLYDALVRAGVPLQIVYRREGLWVTSGRMLWRRDRALTEFVVTVRAPAPASP